jgi:hypothetical protein
MEYKDRCEFKNLPRANVFKVRTKFANSLQGTAVYSFTFLKPWYRNRRALFLFNNWYCFARIIDKAYKLLQKKEDKLIEENNRLLEIKELENGRNNE